MRPATRYRGAALAAVATAWVTLVAPVPTAEATGGEVGGSGASYFLNDTWSATANHELVYGRADDRVLVGDWDGAAGDSLAVRRDSTYHLSNALSGGVAQQVVTYGRSDDTVLVGDWDGDGVDTLAARRGNEYHFKNDLTGGPADRVVVYGRPDDTVLVGDWDGDGVDTLAVRRGNEYHFKNSLGSGPADRVVSYGRSSDAVLTGDWDGDGADTLGVRRASTYYVKDDLAGGPADRTLIFGRADDVTLVGDWNGDQADTLGVRRSAPSSVPVPPSTSLSAAQALAALEHVDVATTLAGGYDRDYFGSGWTDADGDGLDTRNEILVRDLTGEVLEDRGSDVVVLSGTLDDPYTGRTINFVRGVATSSEVQIDHVVALSAAWQLGASKWTDARRREFYNDFDNLLAVDGPTNSAKGDDTLAEWQPPNAAFRCEYAITYIEVVVEYDLALTDDDVRYARTHLPEC